MKERAFSSETDLVQAFCTMLPPRDGWVAYHETAGWDLLLVNPAGLQVGFEAKLSLNAKVLEQALPGVWTDTNGPDYRAVLVPADSCQHHLTTIARHLGIVVVTVTPGKREPYSTRYPHFHPSLPDESYSWLHRDWPNWCPVERCKLPEYVPDVTGGKAAPVQLSPWKIKAVKLLILLERHGSVSRRDMKALGISPTRWTDHYAGFLSPGPEGYVRNTRTPDLRAQHPTNWAQIEADFDRWSKDVGIAGRLGIEVAA